jgi:hypothetical protein
VPWAPTILFALNARQYLYPGYWLAMAAVPSKRITTKENDMSIGTILLIILVLVLVGVIPTWGHSKNWGYGPSGGLGLVVVILLILLLLGKI